MYFREVFYTSVEEFRGELTQINYVPREMAEIVSSELRTTVWASCAMINIILRF